MTLDFFGPPARTLHARLWGEWGDRISCLAAFFFGQHAANLAGPMEFVLFMTGLALVAAEIFIIPGFGIAGITGALFMLYVVGKGFLDFEIPWEVASDLGYVEEGMEALAVRIGLVGRLRSCDVDGRASSFDNPQLWHGRTSTDL